MEITTYSFSIGDVFFFKSYLLFCSIFCGVGNNDHCNCSSQMMVDRRHQKLRTEKNRLDFEKLFKIIWNFLKDEGSK